MSEITVCLIIAVVTMILFIGRVFPMALTSVLCALAMGICLPSVKLSAIYSGFGTAPVYMIAGMTIVGDALFQTGVAQKIGITLSKMKIFQSERIFTVMVVVVCTLMSAFMSDSGCIAMWMPIIAAVAAGSKGKIRSKMVIMPAGIACIVGGATTLVGSTSQNTANSFLMQVPGFETGMGVFDMTSVMWMVDALMVLYFATIGYTITKKTLKPGSPHFDDGNVFAQSSEELDNVPQASTRKQVISVFTLLLCILGFILCGFAPFNKYLNIANVALIGASILFVTKTIDYKTTLKKYRLGCAADGGVYRYPGGGIGEDRCRKADCRTDPGLLWRGGCLSAGHPLRNVRPGQLPDPVHVQCGGIRHAGPYLYPSGPAHGSESGTVHHPDCHCLQHGHRHADRDTGEYADPAGRV